MATVQEIRENVLAYGFSSANFTSRINRWIDEAQRVMFRKAGLRMKEEAYEFETVAGTKEYSLPSKFGSIVSLFNHTTEPHENLVEIESIKEYDEMEETKGEPVNYIIHKNQIYIWPIPSSVYKLTLRYNIVPSSIAAENSASPTIAEDFIYLIEEYVLFKCFGAEGDIELANYHKGLFDTGMVDFVGMMNTDSRDGVRQIEGAWPHEWGY